MAIYPKAKKELISKWNQNRMTRYRRVNLHVAVSERQSIKDLFTGGANACSHFYVAKDGTVYQYIDTRYMSASDRSGNDSTISVETAGGLGSSRVINAEKWTAAQMISLAELWAWCRDTHGIKNQVAKNTQTNENSEGLSWHRLGIQGNFKGRGEILETSYRPGGILYSGAFGKECPGDAKILQIPTIFKNANGKKYNEIKGGEVKPQTPSKPTPVKPKPNNSKAWPKTALEVTTYHTTESHNAWVYLMGQIGYKDKDLGLALQKWLRGLGYYSTKWALDGDFGTESVKALQKFLRSKGLYGNKWLIDGKRQAETIKAEINYLNDQAKYL